MNRFLTVFLFLTLSIASAVANPDGGLFIENKSQWDSDVFFRLDIPNGKMYLTRTGIRYTFYDPGEIHGPHGNHSHTSKQARMNNAVGFDKGQGYNVFFDFLDANIEPEVVGMNKVSTYFNFFIGNDPDKWASGVSAYPEITYKNLYPGIDMRLYFSNGALKYDLILDEKAKAEDIKFRYRGFEELKLSFGSIYLNTTINEIIDNPPYAYQVDDRDTVDILCRYNLTGNTIRFDLPDGYARDRKLVIDPALVFSTYSGSTMDNWGNTATYDDYGNVYSGGTVRDSYGGNLPVTEGAYQAYFGGVWDLAILKFDSLGKDLLYGTYLGGSDAETPFSLIVNKNDELLILGITGSSNFPVTPEAYSQTFSGGTRQMSVIGGVDYRNGSDFFIAKLSYDGKSLISSTYLGGSGNDGINFDTLYYLSKNYGDEFRGEINIDNQNNVYLVSNTSSRDFPIINGFQTEHGGGNQDAIIAKLSPELDQLIWSSYLGGSNNDCAYSVKIKNDSTVYTTGGTISRDFPTTENGLHPDYQGGIDGFITQIGNNGQTLVASSYLGTFEYEQAYFLDIDFDGNIYVLGQTRGDYPVTPSTIYSNPLSGQFIHKLKPDLSESIWSTVVGSRSGHPDISLTAFMVNECGNIYLSGWGGNVNQSNDKYVGGSTFNMPITEDAFQDVTDGSDFYLMVLEKDAHSLLYSTYLGAFNPNESGEHVDGGTCRFDKRGIVYHAICACRDASGFPTTPGVWSEENASWTGDRNTSGCNNGVFKFDLSALSARFTTNTPEFDHLGINLGCVPFDVVFLNQSIGGKAFHWEFGDGTESTQKDSIPHTYEIAGTYDITLTAIDQNTCKMVDIAKGQIYVFEDNFKLPTDITICYQDIGLLEAGGAIRYSWSPAEGLDQTNISNPKASPDSTTTYYLTMVDENGCEQEDSVLVTVIPEVTSEFLITKQYDCLETPTISLSNLSSGADQFNWTFGEEDPKEVEDSVFFHHFEKRGEYTIVLESISQGKCTNLKSESVYISDIFVPNVITPNGDEKNDTFVITTDANVELSIQNRWGKQLYYSPSYDNNWAAEGLSTGVYYYEFTMNNDVTCNGWVHVLK